MGILIAITWLYIVVMMAVTASSWLAGIALFLIAGVAPVALWGVLKWRSFVSRHERMRAWAPSAPRTQAEHTDAKE